MGQKVNNEKPSPPRTRRCGWRCWLGIIAGVVVVAVLGTGEWLVHHAEPMLRQRVVDSLSARLNSRVTLAQLHISFLQGLAVTGSGLQVYPDSMPAGSPLLTVEKFSFHTRWHDLFRYPMAIALVKVSGLHLNIPPKQLRKQVQALHVLHHQGGEPKQTIRVGRVIVDHAVLTLETEKPGKQPLIFIISNIRLDASAQGRPRHFTAQLINPKPVGEIATQGSFGPFDAQDPGNTMVQGHYSFAHADLATIKGIGGTLSSQGEFQGALNRIVVDGETDTPDFYLTTAHTPVPLHTQFHAVVNGMNGDTYLEPVNAVLGHSHIIARGQVARGPDGRGHEIDLEVVSDPANIEDFLRLAVKTDPPLMTGVVSLHFSLKIPPGDASVVEKLLLNGTFDLQNAHFNNPKFQAAVDNLSLRAQGKARQAEEIKDERKQPPAQSGDEQFPDVASQMQGHFDLGNEKLTIQHLVYTVPGAEVGLDGVYSLDGQEFQMHGVVRTSAKASQMVTGWKSVALKVADPFLKKNGAGMQVPIQISGTRSSPHFGLDFKHRQRDEQALPQNQQDQPPR